MTYFRELGANWRAVAAAGFGFAAGYNLYSYIASIFTPYLLDEFGWSKAQFSLVGTVGVCTIVCAPIAGRLVDTIGVRAMAGAGIVCNPLLYFAFSHIGGSFGWFMALSVVHIVLLGMLTTSVVYSRLIAENFTLARGIALALMASAPAIVGAVCAPLLSHYIDAEGWRAGYRALAVFTAVLGAVALVLMPRSNRAFARTEGEPKRDLRQDYRAIFSSPVFYVIMAGMVLCNLTILTNSTQLKLILLERQLSSDAASWIVSLFALSIAAGRLVVGVALDRLPVHLIVAAVMAFPGVGLFILASGVHDPRMLAAAVAILGFSTGADGDVMAFVVMRFFKVEVFSSVLGLVGAAVALSGASGAMILSWTLSATGTFGTFLTITAFAAFAGGAVFLLLGRPTALQTLKLGEEPG